MHTIKETASLRPIGSVPDLCLSSGTCSAGCPITGIGGFDPRKIIRMAIYQTINP